MKSSKRKYTWIFVAVTTAIFFSFFVKIAQAGDPIPGVDVSLEQVPGSVLIARTTTDEDGRFSFDELTLGKYLLRISPSPIIAEKFNFISLKLSQNISSDGIEVYKVSIELRRSENSRIATYKAIPIMISAEKGGRITGEIIRQ